MDFYILRFRMIDILEEEDLVDDGVVIYAATVVVRGPAIARCPPLHTRGGRRAPDAAGDA